MARRSGLLTLGLCWDLLRFFLIFLFLVGDSSLGLLDGNFMIILLGVSGQPLISLIWKMTRDGSFSGEILLLSVRFPGILIELLAVILFFTGNLPGRGDALLFENTIFPGGTGLLLLLFILVTDIIFQLILLTFSKKES